MHDDTASRTLVEVLDVSCASAVPGLAGFAIDAPARGARSETYAIRLSGWVLGEHAPVDELELEAAGRTLRRVPVRLERPDVARVHPGHAHAATCGFDVEVGLLGLPASCDLRVQAVLPDGSRSLLAGIALHRVPLGCAFGSPLAPLIVTSLFRTGTTRMMRLLAEHPRIVVQRIYPYETRVFSYWLQVLKVVSEPANLHESCHPDDFLRRSAWVGNNPFYRKPISLDRDADLWLGRGCVERLAEFCREAGEEFYRRVAQFQGQTDAVYFAEKHVPDSCSPELFHELYGGAKEIFLVRDFRDMVCSIRSFNAKRGYLSFERQHVESDEEMIRILGRRASSLLAAWRRRSSSARLVRYEDLISDPRGTLRGMLEYLELDPSDSEVEKVIERADRDTPEMRYHRTSDSPQRSLARWRRELDPETIALCEESFREALDGFGYAPALAPTS